MSSRRAAACRRRGLTPGNAHRARAAPTAPAARGRRTSRPRAARAAPRRPARCWPARPGVGWRFAARARPRLVRLARDRAPARCADGCAAGAAAAPRPRAARERVLHHRRDHLRLERLGDVAHHVLRVLVRLPDRRALRRHQDDRRERGGRRRRERRAHVGRAHVGQDVVEQDQVRRERGRALERLRAVGREVELVAERLQDQLERATDRQAVVDDQDAGRAHDAATSGACDAAPLAARRAASRVDQAARLEHQMRPAVEHQQEAQRAAGRVAQPGRHRRRACERHRAHAEAGVDAQADRTVRRAQHHHLRRRVVARRRRARRSRRPSRRPGRVVPGASVTVGAARRCRDRRFLRPRRGRRRCGSHARGPASGGCRVARPRVPFVSSPPTMTLVPTARTRPRSDAHDPRHLSPTRTARSGCFRLRLCVART